MSGAIDGAAFALDAPEHVVPVWGAGHDVLWAAGEPLMICGPEGVGKTTLCQQLALRRMGIGEEPDLLGHRVTPDSTRKVMYLALDRPRQAARSMRRMVTEHDRGALRDRLVAWTGTLPFDLVHEPAELAALAARHGAGTVFLDCLKDVGGSLSDETVGQAIDRAMQACVEAGIEFCGLHHQRKAQAENKRPRTLADVYGSRWLTAGCGSVALLWGEAGDPIVEFVHLKQPADEVGPLTLLHDNRRGTTSVHHARDIVALVLAAAPDTATAKSIAAALRGGKEPKPNDVEKARRRLEAAVEGGRLRRVEAGPRGAVGYVIADQQHDLTHDLTHLTHDPTDHLTPPAYVVGGREDPHDPPHDQAGPTPAPSNPNGSPERGRDLTERILGAGGAW